MTDQYAELRRALTHYRAEPDSVIAQAMVTRRATPDLVSVLLAERDALLQRLREIVESVEERDREIKRRARAMKIMSERVKELTARLKQYEPVSPWGGAAPANEKEAE